MNDTEREALSALLDDEAGDLELRRLLKSLDNGAETDNEALYGTWTRYQLVRDILHDRAVPVSAGLSRRISAAVAEEPAYVPDSVPVWRQHLAKVAIAASVAVVGVISLQSTLQTPGSTAVVQDGSQETVQESVQDSVTGPDTAPSLLAETDATPQAVEAAEIDPVAQQRLRDYLSGITVDVAEPSTIEHIQDSPLFQLVNELQALP